ncbi:hypothetical protein K438DRAFT_375201 [Mycena galopus ATCC 62051]|nr:hypothetical protein K438DRAFT_375201 [Mycena galopus ATCC 62051]
MELTVPSPHPTSSMLPFSFCFCSCPQARTPTCHSLSNMPHPRSSCIHSRRCSYLLSFSSHHYFRSASHTPTPGSAPLARVTITTHPPPTLSLSACHTVSRPSEHSTHPTPDPPPIAKGLTHEVWTLLKQHISLLC